MTYYEAKFARYQKARPIDWLVIPNGCGRYRLAYIGGNRRED